MDLREWSITSLFIVIVTHERNSKINANIVKCTTTVIQILSDGYGNDSAKFGFVSVHQHSSQL